MKISYNSDIIMIQSNIELFEFYFSTKNSRSRKSRNFDQQKPNNPLRANPVNEPFLSTLDESNGF